MSWRTIYIQSASKLSLNLNNIQIKYNNEKYNICIDEIQTLIIEDFRCLVTGRLLAKCAEEGINVIFCKDNKMPIGALHSLDNNSRTVKYTRNQLKIQPIIKAQLWKEIIEFKIYNQINTLKVNGKEYEYLEEYLKNVEVGDLSNKEGQAARVYFPKLFGEGFTRDDDNLINFCLNYTYQILRSKIAQEIIARGLHPSFGIFHKGEYNFFNLADDIIEPYRPLVDNFVINILNVYKFEYVTPKLKEDLLIIYNYEIEFEDKKEKLVNSIPKFINKIVDIYNGKSNRLSSFPQLLNE